MEEGLLGAAEVRDIARRWDIHPTKHWGQNFVVDANTVRRIVRLADVQSDDVVLEVGPGIGSLTLGLLAAGVLSKIVSAVTTPAADTRTWDNLPNLLGFATLHAAPGEHQLVAEFVRPDGTVAVTREVRFTVVDPARDTVLFLSDRNP